MSFRNACLTAILLLGPAAARAEPVKDPAAWTQRFLQAALKADADAMGALVDEGAAAGLNAGAIKATIQAAVKAQASQQVESAETFGEANVGTFYKRLNVAVLFKKGYYFYSFAFGRHGDGWTIYNFRAYDDVNKILNVPWPD